MEEEKSVELLEAEWVQAVLDSNKAELRKEVAEKSLTEARQIQGEANNAELSARRALLLGLKRQRYAKGEV